MQVDSYMIPFIGISASNRNITFVVYRRLYLVETIVDLYNIENATRNKVRQKSTTTMENIERTESVASSYCHSKNPGHPDPGDVNTGDESVDTVEDAEVTLLCKKDEQVEEVSTMLIFFVRKDMDLCGGWMVYVSVKKS